MKDAQVAELAGRQFNRISRQQLTDIGLSDEAIRHRIETGRLAVVADGVYAIAPVLNHDDWGNWMGATLTAPGTLLSHESATDAYGLWSPPQRFVTVTRSGRGGPRRLSGVLVYRSSTLDGDRSVLEGIPITSVPRTLLDASARATDRRVARLVREAVRMELTSLPELGDALGRLRGRRGAGRLAAAVARYVGLPIQRARSGAEIRALEVIRDAGRPLPRLNIRVAGEEADLSWPVERLIIEIDGGPFHLDVGEDARKEARWRAAGWTVRRLPAGEVYDHPHRLLALAPSTERPNVRLITP